MTQPIRWGILGTGSIARKFAEGLRAAPDAVLAAVGSRAQATADSFGEAFGIARRHGSYEALAADPEVDVVYIATPHPLHRPNAMLCIEQGKAVLCEKPFTVNARGARAVVEAARKRKTFLMEAMWTRFLPTLVQTRQWLAEGRIGEVRMVEASFGFRAGLDETSRILAPDLAGGGLLDVGVYTISLASMVFARPPDEIAALADIGSTGVDEQAVMIFRYQGGALAMLSCAVRTDTRHHALIMGTEGMIILEPPFWVGTAVTLERPGQPPRRLEMPFEGNGYHYEAHEVMACMRAGKLESEIMPLDETVSIIETMDAVRQQWGLKYPIE